jgi:hypothetical protein
MEDYQAAFLERHKDTEILCSSTRKVAAMHFGGCTVECLFKSMILASLPRGANREWKTDSNNPGHTITNPGHSFQDALRRHNRLNSRIDKFPVVKKWIDIVENPNQHFIDMRYCSNEPDDADYKQWLSAYQSLRSWLQKQATQL